MNRKEHGRSCEAAFGEAYAAVHDFLDQHAKEFPREHRKFFHHRQGLAIIRERFGPEAVKAAERHIFEDEGCIPEDHAYYRVQNAELIRRVRQLYASEASP